MVRRLLFFVICCALATASAQPLLPPGTLVNAADYTFDLSPGAIASIFGEKLSTGYEAAGSLPLPTSIGGTSVEATDGARTALLPLFMVSEGQINAQLPYGMGPELTIRIRSPHGESHPTAVSVAPRSPKLFTWDQSGAGTAVVTHSSDGAAAGRNRPVRAGEWITIWANGLGEVNPPVPAGEAPNDGSDGRPLHRLTGVVTVRINGQPAEVGYAGLAPNQAGLYQINAFTPYSDRAGDAAISVEVDGAATQPGLLIPVEANGFYWVLGAGKSPNGQTRTAVDGAGSAVLTMHDDRETWGEDGYRRWTAPQGLSNSHVATSGLALTLQHGSATVYDNNGIEDGSHGGYYVNSIPGSPDADAAGLTSWIAHSTNYRVVNASHFRLERTTTFDQVIAYFDGNGDDSLPFDPANAYNRYRVNIWSNGPGGVPANNTFAGDILSSDSAGGVFAHSPTSVSRIRGNTERDPVHRLVYTLPAPLTLAPGDYWFASDAALPEVGAAAASASSGSFRVVPSGVNRNR